MDLLRIAARVASDFTKMFPYPGQPSLPKDEPMPSDAALLLRRRAMEKDGWSVEDEHRDPKDPPSWMEVTLSKGRESVRLHWRR